MNTSQAYMPSSTIDEQQRDPIIDFGLRWWWLLAIGVIIGGGLGYAYAHYGPTSYESSTYVQVGGETANAGEARSASLNFAAEAGSPRILELTSAALAGQFPVTGSELQAMSRAGQIEVGQSQNFIQITVRDADPDRAQAVANAMAGVLVTDVNERIGAQFEARQLQRQQQIDFARERLATSALFQRKQDLQAQLRAQQASLITLQASYQQELARQAAAGDATQSAPTTPAGEPVDVAGVISAQITGLQASMDATNSELQSVEARIADLPPETDPVTSAALASAYANEVSSLSSLYVNAEVNSLTANPPLVQYGAASDPFEMVKTKKFGMLGVMAGGAVAAAVGFLIDLLLKRRRRARSGDGTHENADVDLAALMRQLEQYKLVEPTTPAHSVVHGNGGVHATRQ